MSAKSTSRVTRAAPVLRGAGGNFGVGRMPQADVARVFAGVAKPASSARIERGMLASTRKRMAYAGSR